MKYLLKNLRVPVDSEQNLTISVANHLKYSVKGQIGITIIRRAIDTRKKNYPFFVYTLEIESDFTFPHHPDLLPLPEAIPDVYPSVPVSDSKPIIVGMGPAGLFCALAMVEKGLKPLLFDRGEKLSVRAATVEDFWNQGNLNPESNVQFGEGGAGAFSDGKLTSRSHNYAIQRVYALLIRFGAPDSIAWEALPHLGTDGIRSVVARIREFLISNGCEFHYNSHLEDLHVKDGRLCEVKINNIFYQPETLVLAIGNAARDTFRLLADKYIELEPKPFSIGFRISHPQDWINHTIYGSDKWSSLLGAASYRLTSGNSGKGTYSFCMCPGGFVIAAASEMDSIVTNGMSWSKRDGTHGNSAIVTSVDSCDYGTSLFDGLQWQSRIEHRAFATGYAAPFQATKDYLKNALSAKVKVPCFFPEVKAVNISDLFSDGINKALKSALIHFDHIMPGFISEGFLIAPETRTSSPLRIVRDKANLNCRNITNLYAIGEGAGYAGGIISSAADGYKTGSIFTL
jgi:uncharacterized protein